VIALLPGRNVCRCSAALLLALPLLTGCGADGYPRDMKYNLRSDPILLEVPATETLIPDRPGQFPILSMANLGEPDNPLYAFYQEPENKGKVLPISDATLLTRRNKVHDELTRASDKEERDRLHKQVQDIDGMIRRLPATLDRVESQLAQMFGTPAEPKVEIDPALNKELENDLKLDRRTLARGSQLYRIHCLHCHGLAGDGRGPTAQWVNPHPRDYRLGLFKFLSSPQDQNDRQKPRRDDLAWTIKQGIDGTSMPAFNVLTDDEVEAMVSYVIHLSLRGQTELALLRELLQEGKLSKSSAAQDRAKTYARGWLEAQKGAFPPDPYLLDPNAKDYEEQMRASVQRGEKFFRDEKDGCVKCHTDFGRSSTFRFDAWGTMVRPRDLTTGIYRGGRRPIDLYWRIALGINNGSQGATMTPFHTTLKPDKNPYKASIWDVVNFVQALPYPAMRSKYGINID